MSQIQISSNHYTFQRSLHRSFRSIPILEQCPEAHDLQHDPPIRRREFAPAVINVTRDMGSHRLALQGPARRAVCSRRIRHKRGLQTVHRLEHPRLALLAQAGPLLAEGLAEVLSVTDGISRGPAVVPRLETVGIEGTVVVGGVHAVAEQVIER